MDPLHNDGMNKRTVISKLKGAETDLRARGVNHVAVFGSTARGEDGPESDIDILVDLDAAIVRTIYDYAGIKGYIAAMFDKPVDVVDREALKPHVRPAAITEAIYAF